MRRRFRAVVPQRWKAFGVVAAVVVAVAFAGVAAFLVLGQTSHRSQKNTTAIKDTGKTATKSVVIAKGATKKATGAQKTSDKALGLGIATLKCLAKPTPERQRACLGITSGAQGPAGDIGARGPAGQSAIGKRGQRGPEGGPGPASTVAGPKGDSVKGDQGEAGFGYDCAGNQVKPGDTPAKCPGDQGPAGKDGADGKDGAPGADGATGQQGPQGNPGPAPTSLTCVPAVDPGVFTCTPN